MKAITYGRYGGPEVLGLHDIPRPVPGPGEVLVRLRATSLNASDWEFLTAKPAYIRMFGLFRPNHPILGSDIAGIVDQVGAGVTRFKPGDAVFGDVLYTRGGLAEYVAAPQAMLAPKPPELSFHDAAALPQGSAIAILGLCERPEVGPGKSVLINGAGGSSGPFAVQLAKHLGATVTAIDAGEKLAALRALGADQVFDYRQHDFTRSDRRYDLILDLAARHSILACRRALAPQGRYLMTGGSIGTILGATLLGPLLSAIGSRKLGLLIAEQSQATLAHAAELCLAGTLKPLIDSVVPLAGAPEALGRLGAGRTIGKIVVQLVVQLAEG